MSASGIIAVERAIAETLGATGAPCAIDRAYPGTYARVQLPAINLVPTGFELNDGESDHDSLAIHAEWAVVLNADGSLDTPGSETIDALIVWVWTRFYADQTLGGTVRELCVSKGAYHYDRNGDIELVHCQLDIAAKFDVHRSDLTANYNVGE